MNFLLTAIIVNKLFIYLMSPCEAASYNHGKRELNFASYANNVQQNLRKAYDGYNQPHNLEDPGFTQQNDNSVVTNQENALIGDRFVNGSNYQNLMEFNKPAGQMFQLVYVPLNQNNGQPPRAAEQLARTLENSQLQQPQLHQPSANTQNLIYTGPQLFPAQPANINLNTKQPLAQNNFNNIPAQAQQNHIHYPAYNYASIHHKYPAGPVMPRYNQYSKMPSKMEAPFMASPFLGFGQQLQQQQQHHVIPPPPYAGQFPAAPHYHQQTKPVHETTQQHYQPSPYNRGNIMFMAANNFNDLYRKSP